MAIELRLTTFKPDNVEWWWNLYPDKMTAIEDYMKVQEGFVSYVTEMKDANTRLQILTFELPCHVAEWHRTFYLNCPEGRERRLYNDTNGIVTVAREVISQGLRVE
jgi:hypothetical protein